MDPTGSTTFDRALALLEERRFSEAVTAFSEVVALSPEFAGAYGNRGLAYLNLGLEDKAVRDFEKVLQLDPDDAMGYAMLAEVSRFRGDPRDTLAYAVEALELDDDEPHAHFVRGWLFARAGQYAEAAEDLGRFLEMVGENDEVSGLHEACVALSKDDPVDELGAPLDTDGKVDAFLSRNGWSFDTAGRDDFEEAGLPCAFAHCIRNCPALSPEAPDGCPVFGYACPGGREQVAWCHGNGDFLD